MSDPSLFVFNDVAGAQRAAGNPVLDVGSRQAPPNVVPRTPRNVLWHRALIDYGAVHEFTHTNPDVKSIIQAISAAMTTVTDKSAASERARSVPLSQRKRIETEWNLVENTMRHDTNKNTIDIARMLLQRRDSPLVPYSVGDLNRRDVTVGLRMLLPIRPGQFAIDCVSVVHGSPLVPPRASDDVTIRSFVRKSFPIEFPLGNGTEVMTDIPLIVVMLEDRTTLQGTPQIERVPLSYLDHSIGVNRVNGFGPFVFSRQLMVVLKSYTSSPRVIEEDSVCFYYDERGQLFHAATVPTLPLSADECKEIAELNQHAIETLESRLYAGRVNEPTHNEIGGAIAAARASSIKSVVPSIGRVRQSGLQGEIAYNYVKFAFFGHLPQLAMDPDYVDAPVQVSVSNLPPMMVNDEQSAE